LQFKFGGCVRGPGRVSAAGKQNPGPELDHRAAGCTAAEVGRRGGAHHRDAGMPPGAVRGLIIFPARPRVRSTPMSHQARLSCQAESNHRGRQLRTPAGSGSPPGGSPGGAVRPRARVVLATSFTVPCQPKRSVHARGSLYFNVVRCHKLGCHKCRSREAAWSKEHAIYSDVVRMPSQIAVPGPDPVAGFRHLVLDCRALPVAGYEESGLAVQSDAWSPTPSN
jgi:hypothetical protein